MVARPETGRLAGDGAGFLGSACSSVMVCVTIIVRSVSTMPKAKNIFCHALVFENQGLGLSRIKFLDDACKVQG
jgi:hypothetical protein